MQGGFHEPDYVPVAGKAMKKEDLDQIKKDLDEQTRIAQERLERLKYLQADFDNYRKWSEKEKASIIALANENLIKDLLVILDDFEQAMPSLGQEKNREGIQMIQKKMQKILVEMRVEFFSDTLDGL